MAYIRKDNEIYYECCDIDGEVVGYERACQDFAISKKYFNVLTDEVSMEIEFLNTLQKPVTVEVKRSDCQGRCPKALLDRDFDITENHLRRFLDIVTDIEADEADTVNVFVHDKLGFHEVNGDKAYFGAESVGLSDVSTYKGSMPVKASGTLNEWLRMVKECVMIHLPTFFAMIAAFSAPIASLFKSQIDDEVIVVSFSGVSTSGKTTVLKLGASIYSVPKVGTGIIDDFVSTENYRIQKMAGREGFAIFLDEATNVVSLENFLYSAANGNSRGRMKQNQELSTIQSWSGTILATCEGSVIQKTSEKEGVFVRVFEIDDEKFTIDAKHAHTIEDTINENYGVAITPFVKHIWAKIGTQILGDFDTARQELDNAVEQKHRLKSRVCKKFAVFLITARYVAECFGLEEYDDEKFLEYLCEKIVDILGKADTNKERDPLECLRTYVAMHEGDFIHGREKRHLVSHPKGLIVQDKNGNTNLHIITTVFKDIMQDNGFSSNSVAKEWKKQHIIYSSDKNACTRKEKIGNTRVYVYSIRLEGMKTGTAVKKAPDYKKKSQIKNLLADDEDNEA